MPKVFTPTSDPVVMAAWAGVAPIPALADFIADREHPETGGVSYFGGVRLDNANQVFPEQFVTAALSRKSALVTLALALHCDDSKALGWIWRNAIDGSMTAKALRRAVLFNPHAVFDLTEEEWREFVLTATPENVESYCRKPVVAQDALTAILAGERPFADLPEERRLLWAFAALDNPNLHRIRPDPSRHPVDGWWEYQERKPFTAALKLLEWVPITQACAWRLAEGIRPLPPRFNAPVEVPKEISDKILSQPGEWAKWHWQASLNWLSKIIDRWTVPEEEAKADAPIGKHKNAHPNGYASLRVAIARLVGNDYQKELREFVETHSDKWVRIGAIASRDFKSADEVRSIVKREGFLVLCHAYSNPAFHRRSRPDVVEAFRSFYGMSASQMAKAEGYEWDDTQFANSWYDQEADRFHAKDPGKYYSANELPDVEPSPNALFSDELPQPHQGWLRNVRSATRRIPDQHALADLINMLAETLAWIRADNEGRQRSLMKVIDSAKSAAWAAAIIAAIIGLRIFLH